MKAVLQSVPGAGVPACARAAPRAVPQRISSLQRRPQPTRSWRRVVCADSKQDSGRSYTNAGVNTWETTNVMAVNLLTNEKGYKFVDIRDGWEAEKYGYYSSWTNIPFALMTDEGPKKNPEFLQRIKQEFPDPNTPIIIACDDGDLRSRKAADEICMNLQYTNIHVLEGGTDDYLYKYPITKASGDTPWGKTSAPAVDDLIDKGYLFVDLRDGWEAEKYGRDPRWINIPLARMTENGPVWNKDFEFEVLTKLPNPNIPVILGCDFGNFRTEKAAKEFCGELGFREVYILEGGIEAYYEEFPLKKK